MLDRLRKLLESPSSDSPAGPTVDPRALASVALLFHAASLDGAIDADEERTIAELARKHFGLAEDETEALISRARQVEEDSSQILSFTRDIKDHSSHEERVALVEMLWEVVFADGEEHAFEANLMRRVAGLIYVTDQESGAARRRVRAKLGLT